jgi:hypothetical protein
MKRKIISIIAVAIMLATIFCSINASSTVIKTKASELEKNEGKRCSKIRQPSNIINDQNKDLPDLTIKIKNVEYSRISGYHTAIICVKNRGETSVPAGETLELSKIALEEDNEIWSEASDWSNNLPLEPNQEIKFTCIWKDHNPKATLKAAVDPNNLIEESDESEKSNTCTLYYPYLKQKSINIFQPRVTPIISKSEDIRVTVKVLNRNNNPVKNVRVSLNYGLYQYEEKRTDRNGKCQFEGDYYIKSVFGVSYRLYLRTWDGYTKVDDEYSIYHPRPGKTYEVTLQSDKDESSSKSFVFRNSFKETLYPYLLLKKLIKI